MSREERKKAGVELCVVHAHGFHQEIGAGILEDEAADLMYQASPHFILRRKFVYSKRSGNKLKIK